MSAFWHVFIGFIAVCSILGTALLLFANARGTPGENTGHVWDGDLTEYNNPLPRWWLNLFVITLVFAVIYLQLYPGLGDFSGSLGWTQEKQMQERLAQTLQQRNARYARFEGKALLALAADPDAIDAGRAIFTGNCAACHGQDARGAIGFPDLTDQDWLYGGDPDTVLASVAGGRRGQMPKFGGTLDDASIALLADTVRNLGNPTFDAARREAGQKLFTANCAACHGGDAHGNPMLGAPNLADGVWLHGGSADAVRATIAGGRSSTMPAHKDLLSAAEIRLVSAYVLSLQGRP